MLFSDFSYLVLTKLASLENSMNFLIPTIKQLMAHFRLTNKSHVKNVPQIPVDSDDNLNNLETFLDNKENFEYMVNVQIFSVLSLFSILHKINTLLSFF